MRQLLSIRTLRALVTHGVLLTAALPAMAGPAVVEVFKSPYCGCCGKWVDHMKAAGFEMRVKDVTDVPAVRKRLGMPDQLGSCHTATVKGYVLEGHVPAADVKKLLAKKPKALGISVPGMPQGSPGMETSTPVPYQTLLVQPNGSTTVFAQH